jgi:hypothetical protein
MRDLLHVLIHYVDCTYRGFLEAPKKVMMLQLEDVFLVVAVLHIQARFLGRQTRFRCLLLADESSP